jgi:hypothetical protein
VSGPIQTIPTGLLGLLQLKELGRNPSQLQDAVQPTYDLFAQYVQQQMSNEFGIFGAQLTTAALVTANHGLQVFTGAVVPQNRIFYVYQLSADIQTQNAADFINAAPAVLQPSGRTTIVAPGVADVISARIRSWITAPITNPFFAAPGSTFGIYVYDILAGTTITVLGTLRAVSIPI